MRWYSYASCSPNNQVKAFACSSLGRPTLRASSRMPSALLREHSLHVERPLPWALELNIVMMILNRKAVLYGVFAYLLIYILNVFVTSVFFSEVENPNEWMAVIYSISVWIALIMPGYISGRISQYSGILHGFVVGLIAGVLSGVFFAFIAGERWYGDSFLSSFIYYLAYIVFMSSIGGGIGQLQSKFRFKA